MTYLRVSEAHLTEAKERIEYLIDRAKYHGDCPLTKQEYVLILEGLLTQLRQVIRAGEVI